MRRPQSAFGLVAVMSSLLVASLFATPASAAFTPAEAEPGAAQALAASSAQCTKWTSQFVPPKRIRVLRTASTDAPAEVRGTVETVRFRDYVAVVMAAEWPEHYPLETLKAGAIATKQFAWYYILNPRGGTRKVDDERVCYDVVDSTVDQYYKPETRGIGKPGGPGPKIMAAVEATWDISLRKRDSSGVSSRFFLTGYRNGENVACGADANGWKLFHNSTRRCGEDRLKFREILRLYLSRLEIVTPGDSDVIGTRHGDAKAMTKDAGRYHTRVWTPGRTPPEPGSDTGLSIAGDDLVSYRSADMNGDGREDLIWLKKTAAREGKIKVALSNGTDYGPDEVWWQGDTIVPLADARLLVGDFFANGRTDVAILSRGESAGTARLVVLMRQRNGSTPPFDAPRLWWSGALDMDKVSSAWAGDVSGDGRADLVVRQRPNAGGVVIKSAMTKSPLPTSGLYMKPMKLRWQSSKPASKVKMVPGDADRDGRMDLLMITASDGRSKVHYLRGTTRGAFKLTTLWTAPTSDPIPVRTTRLGTADVDYDGRSDLVLYSERGQGKTRLRVLSTRYGGMVQQSSRRVGLKWASVVPY